MSMIDILESGDLLGFIAAPYLSAMGEFFFVLITMLFMGMLYLKTQEITLPAIMSLMFIGAFGFAFPENVGIPILMLLGISFAVIMYKVFKTGRFS